MGVKLGSRNKERNDSGISSSVTMTGAKEEIETLYAGLFPGMSTENGKVSAVRMFQESPLIWACEIRYASDFDGNDTSEPNTAYGQKSAQLSGSMLSLPLEAHPKYRTCWNYYLVAAPGISSVPSWWATAREDGISGNDADKYAWVKELASAPVDKSGKRYRRLKSPLKPGVDSFTVIGKGNKPRLCFIDPVTHKYLDEYLALRDDPYPALFVPEQQKGQEKINPGVVQMVVKNAAIKAGLDKNIHPHTLRHSFATDLLRNNTNIVYVKELLGHASVQVTMTYTHVVNEDLREIHRLKHTVVHA